MQFPVYFHVAGYRLHAHLAMELIAYTGGFQIYLWLRRRRGMQGKLPFEQNMWILVGCVFGALVGSKVLAWAESWRQYWEHRGELMVWAEGKTIVGGLLGGWAGVELVKRALGIKRSTGDLFVFPLIFGMVVGRIGCFLTGLTDHTYGIATSLPWGVDFGDRIHRHPTQLYEMLFLLLWGVILAICSRRRTEEWGSGRLFRIFMMGYLAMRLAIEFIKPTAKPFAGLSAIQLACIGGVVACGFSLAKLRKVSESTSIYTHASGSNPLG